MFGFYQYNRVPNEGAYLDAILALVTGPVSEGLLRTPEDVIKLCVEWSDLVIGRIVSLAHRGAAIGDSGTNMFVLRLLRAIEREQSARIHTQRKPLAVLCMPEC